MSAPKNLLQISEAAKSFGSRTLFEDAHLAVNENEHIGVIGPNGAGKTTLFKSLVGDLELDSGEIIRSRELRLGYLKQHDDFDPDESVEDFLSKGTITPIWELKKLGSDLGLTEEQFASPLMSLSGGYRMRAKLLKLLGEEPNLMLLDEPTNYLDLETILVLQDFLSQFQGAFMLISHDREFLRKTTDHILEIEAGEFVKFKGSIDEYFDYKELMEAQLQAQAQSAAAKRKDVLDFVSKFGAKASKAKQAQSRLKQLNKMEVIELKPVPTKARIKIPEPFHTGKLAAEINDVDMGYGEKIVLHRVEIKIQRGDHLGVVGFNGQGKSTFLKSLAKEIPCLEGEIAWGYQVEAAYYAQHVSERLLDEDQVIESLSRVAHKSVSQQEILDMAGSLLFSGDDMRKQIKVLSGGEKARVALGQTLLRKAPLLILDEPTNHLDFYTVEALTQALEKYAGSVVVVSHDRGFIKRIATKIVEIRSGQMRLFPGTYDEYVWRIKKEDQDALDPIRPRSQKKAPSPLESASPLKAAIPSISPVKKVAKKELESKKRSLEKTCKALERKIEILKSMMNEQNSDLLKASGEESARIAQDLAASQRKIDELEEEYLAAIDEQESVIQSLKDLKK